MLIKADKKELERPKRALTARTVFCGSIVDEFVNGDMDCARVEEYEEHGDYRAISASLRNRIKAMGLEDVRVCNRKGKVYLVKGEL